MAPVGWVCPRCGARNAFELVRCRICASIQPGASFRSPPEPRPDTESLSSPQPFPDPEPFSTSETFTTLPPPLLPPPSSLPAPPAFEPFAPLDMPPPSGAPLSTTPPPGSPPPPAGYPPPPAGYPALPPSPAKKTNVGVLVAIGVVALVVVVGVIGFVASRRTDPKAIADRDAADRAQLTTSDIGGQWQLVANERHALGQAASVFINSPSCHTANAVDVSAEVERVYVAQQGPAIAVVGSSIVVTDDTDASNTLFQDLRAVAQPCITALLRKAGAGVSGFVVGMHENDNLSVGDRSATYTGSVGVPGAGAAEIDALVMKTGRSVLLLLAVDTTGSVADRHFETWANDVIAHLEAGLPAR